jgi:hypothetical protein
MNAYIDIYYCKSDNNYTLYADVRFRNIYLCKCYGYARKIELIESERRVGYPTIESMKSLLDEFIDKLTTIQFDKRSGSFTKNDDPTEECCVCLEETTTKTNCGHTICVPCWNQIKKIQCPLCRNDDIYMHCDYCSNG